MLNVDEGSFYRPKILLCAIIWACMVAEKAYLQIMRLQDPVYFIYENTDHVFLTIRVVELTMLGLYLVYFLIVSYLVLFVLNMMKKAYKYLILLTLFVIASSLVILFLSGRNS